jgi:hypothetical protein
MPFPRTSSRKGRGILTIEVEYSFEDFEREPVDGRVLPWNQKLAPVVCVKRSVYLFGAVHLLFHGDGRRNSSYLQPSVRRYRGNEKLNIVRTDPALQGGYGWRVDDFSSSLI